MRQREKCPVCKNKYAQINADQTTFTCTNCGTSWKAGSNIKTGKQHPNPVIVKYIRF